MNKKIIIMTAAAGLVSFGGAFVFSWFTKPAPKPQNLEVDQQITTDRVEFGEEIQPVSLQSETAITSTVSTVDGGARSSGIKKTMTEKQLKALIYEVREKIIEYNNKLKELEQYEQRLQLARDMLKKDNEELNNLRIELASIVTSFKNERDKLLKSRVEIAEAEKANLQRIAATYDKMDAASASKILSNMSQAQSGEPGGGSLNDAVKILNYMGERTKAKLLAELAASEPELAAFFSRKLKQVIEKD